MRVRHLNCGTMHPPASRLVNGDRSLLTPGRLVCHCLLVEAGDRLVLVDTGIGLSSVNRPTECLGRRFLRTTRPRLEPRETAVRQVTELGYSADDVTDIVLTHLDVDHAGGLADFPRARVHVYGTELRSAQTPTTSLERNRYRRALWSHGSRWVVHELADGDHWRGFQAVRQPERLPDGMLLVPLAGHTRGHVGVAVDTGAGWLLHAGDAYFYRKEMATPPQCTPGLTAFQVLMQADGITRRHNQERLRELVAQYDDVTVFCTHDPVELRRSLRGQEKARQVS